MNSKKDRDIVIHTRDYYSDQYKEAIDEYHLKCGYRLPTNLRLLDLPESLQNQNLCGVGP